MLNKLTHLFQFMAIACSFAIASGGAIADEKPDISKAPKVGEEAADFELKSIDDKTVSLHKLTEKSPVVLVVLRGWPGYQCPACLRQVADFIAHAAKLNEQQAQVVMVYPGPEDSLTEHAKEFIKEIKVKLPSNYHLVTDPDFKFTTEYRLRWDAPNETAFPSAFVIGKDNHIKFAHTSDTHTGRVTADQAIEALSK